MMVTFVSQCEKKSLAKTRRVLDAFANRIGSRTWQTVITNEGLQAVKKLLRKTASKNTAVSCHWIRSRSRSEFLWVVGTKDKFNAQGIVPVNYTVATELNIDEIYVMTEKLFANTHGQPLDQHLFAVGYLAHQIIKRLVNDNKLANAAFVAGCWHDMGKVDPAFQTWLAKELKKKIRPEEIPEEGQHIAGKISPKKHPRHNEISFLLFLLLNKHDFGNDSLEDLAKHTIYWHHAKWIRAPDPDFSPDMIYGKLKKNVGDSNVTEIYHTITALSQKINLHSEEYCSDDKLLLTLPSQIPNEKKLDSLEKESLPPYKQYALKETVGDYHKNIGQNARNNLARTAVVTADRLVSGLSSAMLLQHIEDQTLDSLLEKAFLKERGLKAHIQDCLTGFEEKYPDSERNNQQKKAANELADEELEVGVLEGPAGCGKTKIALEWAANTGVKKIIWVCPRVQVCQGLMHDLTGEDYLYNAKVEIHTGEFKLIHHAGETIDTPEGASFSGDIVITTIDQIINSVITHRSISTLVQYMDAHVVFDEFHEYINMSGFNLLFAELVKCKQLQEEKAQILLVSATPNYYFVTKFLDIPEDDIVSVDSFNTGQYQITFTAFDEKNLDDRNPLYAPQTKNTFVISNTATTSQQSFIANQSGENAVLLHSKYKKIDKDQQFEKVFKAFKRDGDKAYDLLRAGPIVQASLNISCEKMISEFTLAENWLQRMGRLNRFGMMEGVSHYVTAIPDSIVETGKQKSGCAKFLYRLHSFASAKAWYAFLQDRLPESKTVNLAELYEIYRDFYDDVSSLKAIEEDFLNALKESVGNINKNVFDPVSYPNKIQPKQQEIKIKKHSLRGNNRFVQMAVCHIRGNVDPDFLEKYIYESSELEANLTESVERICGYGDTDQDLLAFMVKKHHNIKEDDCESYGVKPKAKFKNKIYLNKSRDPATPIYLSYTPADLKQVEAKPHSHAIYYAIGDNQPIGAISSNNLNAKKES